MSAAVHRDRPSLTGDSSVGAVIAAFAEATDPGRGRRELRSPLSHIDAELGTMPIRRVRARHVVALLDDLRAAGLSPKRQMAVINALHSLFAFAITRRLVTESPMAEVAPPARDDGPPTPAAAPASPRAEPEEQRTPTLTMLALGARVAWWTALIVTMTFVALALGLVVELA
jgi:hypothetical protein